MSDMYEYTDRVTGSYHPRLVNLPPLGVLTRMQRKQKQRHWRDEESDADDGSDGTRGSGNKKRRSERSVRDDITRSVWKKLAADPDLIPIKHNLQLFGQRKLDELIESRNVFATLGHVAGIGAVGYLFYLFGKELCTDLSKYIAVPPSSDRYEKRRRNRGGGVEEEEEEEEEEEWEVDERHASSHRGRYRR